MKQRDLRFADRCSCLIESSVAHPPTLECIYLPRPGIGWNVGERGSDAFRVRLLGPSVRAWFPSGASSNPFRVRLPSLRERRRRLATSARRGARDQRRTSDRLRTFSVGSTRSANWSPTGGRGVAGRMDGVGTQGAMNYAAVPDIPVNFPVNRFGKFLSRHVSGQVIRSVFAGTIFFRRAHRYLFDVVPFVREVIRESSDPTYLSRAAVRRERI